MFFKKFVSNDVDSLGCKSHQMTAFNLSDITVINYHLYLLVKVFLKS